MAYYVSSSLDANVAQGPLVIRAGVSPANVDRAVASIDEEIVAAASRRADAAGARRIAAVPDRLDAARARDQRRASRISAGRGVLRPRPRLRRPRCRICCKRRHAGRGERRRAPTIARSRIARDGRSIAGPYRGPMNRPPTRAVFFDVDFTLIYPGPDVPRRRLSGVLRALRHGRRSVEVRSGGRERGAAARQPGRRLRSGDLHRLHAPHHRADGRRGAAHRRVRARDLREWAACQHFELYDDVPAVLRQLAPRACASG